MGPGSESPPPSASVFPIGFLAACPLGGQALRFVPWLGSRRYRRVHPHTPPPPSLQLRSTMHISWMKRTTVDLRPRACHPDDRRKARSTIASLSMTLSGGNHLCPSSSVHTCDSISLAGLSYH